MALWAAGAVVVAELGVITWIRRRYMDTPWVSAALQVGLGGVLVFITGVLIGSSKMIQIADSDAMHDSRDRGDFRRNLHSNLQSFYGCVSSGCVLFS